MKGPWAAALVAAVFGIHPVVLEPVSWFATQPLLVATTCTLLSVEAWIRYRAGHGGRWLAAALAGALAAVTSYEAAVALPLLIVAGDVVYSRPRDSGSRWPARAALIALLVPYFVLVRLNQAGATALETSHPLTATQAWTVARVDLGNYLFKALGLVQAGRPSAYWIYNALGEPVALLLLMLAVVPILWWARRRPPALFGLFVFFAFLAPSWVVRATIGSLNIPSLRAVYLPLLGVAMVVAVAPSTVRCNATAIAAPLPAACIVDRQPHQGAGFGGCAPARHANGVGTGRCRAPVIVVGDFASTPRRSGCLRGESRLAGTPRAATRPAGSIRRFTAPDPNGRAHIHRLSGRRICCSAEARASRRPGGSAPSLLPRRVPRHP